MRVLDKSFELNEINCNYYLPDEFREKIAEETYNKNHFSLIHLNIRSIANKFGSFKELLDSLDIKFKIIGLTETWLKEYNDDNFELLNYDYIDSNRTNKKRWRHWTLLQNNCSIKFERTLKQK